MPSGFSILPNQKERELGKRSIAKNKDPGGTEMQRAFHLHEGVIWGWRSVCLSVARSLDMPS